MIDVIDNIARFLEDSGAGPAFCDSLPDMPDEAIAVYEYQSGAPYGGLGFDAGAATRNLQIRIRAKTRRVCYAKAMRIYGLLRSTDESPIQLPELEAVLRLRNTPVKLEEDARNRVIFVFS